MLGSATARVGPGRRPSSNACGSEPLLGSHCQTGGLHWFGAAALDGSTLALPRDPCCRFSRRRVPDHKRIVQCPLCRELFIVPHSVLPEEVVALTTAPPPAPRASLESRRSSQRSQQLALVAPAAVASPSPVMSPAPLV